MAGLTLSGSTTPGLNVAAWRAARFSSAGQAVPVGPFPSVGATIPSSPDAGPVVAAGNGSWSINTTTQEDFIVATYDGQNRIVNWNVIAFHPPRLSLSVQILSGAGDPSVLPYPIGSNGDLFVRTDGGAGTCIYQKRGGVWTATAA